MEDQEILGLLEKRSEQALGEVERRYGALCLSLARRLLGRNEDAEECVNDAYLRLWNAVPPAKPESLGAYLCRIVRNLALRRIERQGARCRSGEGYALALEELEECLASPEAVEAQVETAELTRVIRDFLDTLDGENRAVFLGRYWMAFSYEEIAARTGLSQRVVSVRLVRLRKRLRKYLTERGCL